MSVSLTNAVPGKRIDLIEFFIYTLLYNYVVIIIAVKRNRLFSNKMQLILRLC